ncbi:MAG: FAD-dependent oxidoreductase [Betaproteobacteria bacterium]|nr:MAG: FAD-dependent oxidoreductase [Betaproteobacteria bacterium]
MDVNHPAQTFDYVRSADQDSPVAALHPLVIVGAGPVGLTLAIDLAKKGIPVVVLDDDHRLSTGSRAICFAKRTLEIFDRLGIGEHCVNKGVSWNVGKVFLREQLLYEFNLLPEPNHQRPAFINLQQYYVEAFLNDAARAESNVDLRWKNKVVGVTQGDESVTLSVDTPDGIYSINARYVVACDGARSPIRGFIGQESKGQVFRDRFLIADVKMTAPFPTERWFWFDPPFHPNQSVLLHKQPDDVWRIDFQLGWDADPELEKRPENVLPRVRALLGADTAFELEWVSVYTFACMRMEKFRHGRVLFAGDSAHGVSPFGARGANSGIQDADNLGWKLAAVVNGAAPDALIDSYCAEREFAADENIMNSTRSTDFITPKSEVSKLFRNAVLELARNHPFARRIVNSGRLSVPSTYADSPLSTPGDDTSFNKGVALGAPAVDAPVHVDGRVQWFLSLVGETFKVVQLIDANTLQITIVGADQRENRTVFAEPSDDWKQRYSERVGSTYLFRPDQHVCARWHTYDEQSIQRAVNRALGKKAQ